MLGLKTVLSTSTSNSPIAKESRVNVRCIDEAD